MNCRNTDALIQRSLDAPLSTAERARLDEHLASCASCRSLWEQYRRLAQVSAAWTRRPGPAETPPDQFTAQVLSRLAAAPSPVDRSAWLPLFAGCLALALLAVLSPLAAPLLPPLGGWRPVWGPPAVPDLHFWLRVVPRGMSGLWAAAFDGLASVRWALWLLLGALPVNALLCLRVQRAGRRAP